VSERGSVAVLLVGVVGVVLLLAAVLGSVGALLRARVEATAAADAAALAAAPVTFLPFGASGSPADEAGRFAAANGARLLSCMCPADPSWEPRTVQVEVEVVVRVWPAGDVAVRAVGRAEFAPALLLAGE
jgi:secretion/DNA translocation related TadE-like protein